MDQLGRLKQGIGNTPLAEIKLSYLGRTLTVFTKLEYYNLTGSVKDRMAAYVIEQAYANGSLKPGDRIVEATSGNTGISFACVGAAMGHPVTIFMPAWMSEERKQIIRCFGADIELVTAEEGGFLGSIAKAEAMAESQANIFLPRQFSNPLNVESHHQSLGKESVRQLADLGLTADAFVAGVGTGGVVSGVGRALREVNPAVQIHPLEPAESPTLSSGHKVGSHRIAGISDDFIPENCDLKQLDAVVTVSDGDGIIMAQKLAQVGLGVGISSGANLVGALQLFADLADDAVVLTIFSDDNKKYLSTDLMREEAIKPDYLAPQVEILDVILHR